jgi:hypothetical protein
VTATTAIRMVLSGVVDKHPKLKVVLGHLERQRQAAVADVETARPRSIGPPHSVASAAGCLIVGSQLAIRAWDGEFEHPEACLLAWLFLP